jgi:O-antigen biosynthesis protein
MRDGLIEPFARRLLYFEDQAAQPEAAPLRVVQLLPETMQRPHVLGKFLYVGEKKFWARGVTYGTFRPEAAGEQFPKRDVVESDFRAMAGAGINCVRVYTVPPRWLLDLAASCALRVMVGLPWQQHVAFLDDRAEAERIVRMVRDSIRGCADHSAVLCYAIGNEVPASIVRWYGRRRIEKFLGRLVAAAKCEDPGALVTYVNYPTTEYLDVPGTDLVSFNVYLETPEGFSAYLARLQNLAGERPLLMTEMGLDSRRNGQERQARSLDWQIAAAFELGCAGVFAFAWTDEWFRGGHDIEDWDFGLTTRNREPKKALAAIRARFAVVPFPPDRLWPKVSVVVCSYNGAATIGQTLAKLEQLNYPDYEVIVVDDGSTDETAVVAAKHRVRLIRTANNGLSSARNVGLHAATGEVIAYIDDDAYPDPDWLTYLASAFMRGDHAGVGGPNPAPPSDGMIADCVANAPGGPVHVLLSDEIAEHIPGVNMAYRRDRLLAVDGFDPRFRVAGDDVDLCWCLQERGWTLGFAPAAVVWHHRRKSLRAYWRQQIGYAKAEVLLQQKWPSRYNEAGHLSWQGRLYGRGLVESLFHRGRIYHGVWGGALFQSVYQSVPNALSALPLMPEWYILLLLCGGLVLLGFSWPMLFWLAPLLAFGLLLTLAQTAHGACHASFHPEPTSLARRLALRCIVAWCHFLQPAARLYGRIRHGLGPWHRRRVTRAMPLPRARAFWSEESQPDAARLADIEQCLMHIGAVVRRGGDFDAWDLDVKGGLFGSVRGIAAVEEHGGGRQLFRLRAWPRVPRLVIGLLIALSALAVLAAVDGALVAAVVLAACAAFTAFMTNADCASAMRSWESALNLYLDQRAALTPIVETRRWSPALPLLWLLTVTSRANKADHIAAPTNAANLR